MSTKEADEMPLCDDEKQEGDNPINVSNPALQRVQSISGKGSNKKQINLNNSESEITPSKNINFNSKPMDENMARNSWEEDQKKESNILFIQQGSEGEEDRNQIKKKNITEINSKKSGKILPLEEDDENKETAMHVANMNKIQPMSGLAQNQPQQQQYHQSQQQQYQQPMQQQYQQPQQQQYQQPMQQQYQQPQQPQQQQYQQKAPHQKPMEDVDEDAFSNMLLPEKRNHDSEGLACIPLCCGFIGMCICIPCTVCCQSENASERPYTVVKEGQIGLKTHLGRFESLMYPGIYYLNPCTSKVI